MKKRILLFLCLLAVCLALLPAFGVQAAPDPDAEASLTLHYQKDGKSFEGLQISIYRVAEALPDGSFELIAPYSSYPVNIHGITMQEQWTHIAATLNAYIVSDGVEPDAAGQTDEGGTVSFDVLPTGLYLVDEAVADTEEGSYVFNRFLVYLPTPLEDGTFDYDVVANPKCTEFVPRTQYTVTKLWQDTGRQDDRPASVTVDIYRDGVLFETQTLNEANNWTYTWQVTGENYRRWTVAERDVPEQYDVTVRQNGNAFSIINTVDTDPEKPPVTGDSFSPMPWVLVSCLSGILLLFLALRRRSPE